MAARLHRLRGAVRRKADLIRDKKHYFVSTGLYFFERIYLLAIGIVLYALLARSYGPETMGVFSYAQTLVSFAAPFLATGAEAIVVRELVRNKDDRNVVMGGAFALITTSTVVVTALPLAYAFFAPGSNALAFKLAVILSLAFIPNGLLIIEHFFKSEMKAAAIVLPRAAVLTVSGLTKIVLAWKGYPITAIATVAAAEAFGIAFAFLISYLRHGQSPLRWRISRAEAVMLFKQAFPAMTSAVVILLFFRVNHVLVAQLSSYTELGKYSAAFQMVQLTGILPLALFSTIYPRLVTLHGSNSAYFHRIIGWLYFGFALLSYLICAATYLFSDFAIHLLLGPKFAGAGSVLSVLIFSSVFTFLASVRAQEINIYNVPAYHLINAFIGLAVLVPISLFLIPRYGAVGAAWGATAGCFVSGVLTSFIFPRTRAAGFAQLRALVLIPPLGTGRA
jgi:O-antigen/teichoic acid export membrane protein